MKGVDKALVETPMEPLDDRDKRPVVNDLLEKHQKEIQKLREEIQNDPLYDANKHDELWILRFVLSHKRKHKEALKSMKHTLQYRKEHGLDEKDIRFSRPDAEVEDCPEMKAFLKYAESDTFIWCVPQEQGPVVTYIRYKGCDQHALVANLDESYWPPTFRYLAEWAFQWCDYTTRTTGRLTKNTRLIDFTGMKLTDVSREMGRRDSKAMNMTEDCYPQLLQSIFLCHPPTWIQIIWRFFRPLLPKRMVEKVDFIQPKFNDKERDRLLAHVPLELLPERYGGKYAPWPVEYPLP